MSIATEVRGYADTVLEQGKTVLDQGKTALSQASSVVAGANKRLVTEAPKPAYAALGVADLVAATVSRRVDALPNDAIANVSKAQQGGQALINRSQDDALARITELRTRLDAGIDSVSALPVVARNTTESYLSTAKELFGKLTARGEAKAAQLRKDSRVAKVIGGAGDVAGAVAGKLTPVVGAARCEVRPVLQSAFDAAESADLVETTPARRSTASSNRRPSTRTSASASPARKSTDRKTAPVKSTARKAATKSAATKSTAARSTPTKSIPTKSTAVKSSTRKSAPAKSAPAKSAPAKSAAAKSRARKSTAARSTTARSTTKATGANSTRSRSSAAKSTPAKSAASSHANA